MLLNSQEPETDMPDHRSFLKSLSTDERIALTAKSDRIGLAHLAVHWGLIGLSGLLIVIRVPGWQAIMLVQGILLVFLFTLLHETCHYTPFRTRWLNDLVGYVCSFVLCLPPNWFRYFHLAHHRYTQDPEQDPELESPKPETLFQYLRHATGLPVYFRHVATTVRNAMGRSEERFVPSTRRGVVKIEARIMLALYACVTVSCLAFSLMEILYVWLIPLLLGQPFLRLYLLAEHADCPTVSDMFENTRTTFTTWMLRRLAWNMPFHAEHHVYPTVPFHRLGDLHQKIGPYLKVTEYGYTRLNRTYISNLGSTPDSARDT